MADIIFTVDGNVAVLQKCTMRTDVLAGDTLPARRDQRRGLPGRGERGIE